MAQIMAENRQLQQYVMQLLARIPAPPGAPSLPLLPASLSPPSPPLPPPSPPAQSHSPPLFPSPTQPSPPPSIPPSLPLRPLSSIGSSHVPSSSQNEQKDGSRSAVPQSGSVAPRKSRTRRARAATGHRGKHAPSVRISGKDRAGWKELGRGDPEIVVNCSGVPPFWCPDLDLSIGEEKENFMWRRDEHEFTIALRDQLEKKKREVEQKAEQYRATQDREAAAAGAGEAEQQSDSESDNSPSPPSPPPPSMPPAIPSTPPSDSVVEGKRRKPRPPPKDKLDTHPDRLMSDEMYVELVHALQSSQPSDALNERGVKIRAFLRRARMCLFYADHTINENRGGVPITRRVPVLCYVPLTLVQLVSPPFAQCLRAIPVSQVRVVLAYEHTRLGCSPSHEAIKSRFSNIPRTITMEWKKHCFVCGATSKRAVNKVPLQPIVHLNPRERYTLDLMEMKEENESVKSSLISNRAKTRITTFHYIAHLIDHATKMTFAIALKEKTMNAVRAWLNTLWAAEGKPCILHTDNGGEFKSAVEKECRRWGVRMVHGRPYTPTTQGVIERANQSLRQALWRLMLSLHTVDWVYTLPQAVNARNLRRHTTTGRVPREVWPIASATQLQPTPLDNSTPTVLQ
jgi:hypothetical protein